MRKIKYIDEQEVKIGDIFLQDSSHLRYQGQYELINIGIDRGWATMVKRKRLSDGQVLTTGWNASGKSLIRRKRESEKVNQT